jgi:aspartyl-tRNA(Asn)/glutamyl-tRNA(Gln) amidotransferase subunit C
MANEPPSKLNLELTRRIADLAKLELSDSDAQSFTAQLASILNYVEALQEVDVRGVEPFTYPSWSEKDGTAFREDEEVVPKLDSNGQPEILKSAGAISEGGFKVPPIL